MKICVTSFGSLGDVEPYFAVARALKARGHDVVVATLDRFRDRIPDLPFASLKVDWDEPRFATMMREVVAANTPFAQARVIFSHTHDAMITATHALTKIDADVIFTHIFNLAGYAAAQLTRRPFVTGHLVSGTIPSDGPSPIGRDLGAFGNTMRRRVIDFTVARATDVAVNRVLTSVGVAPVKQALRRALHSPLLNLVAVSASVRQRDPSWPERYVMTGAWRTPTNTPLPETLETFLRSGPPPVFVTLGSTVGFDAKQISRILRAGLGDTRAVIQAGWAQLDGGFMIDGFVDYDALLPRVRGVVHHGGAGTTAACLHNGAPMIVISAIGDQQAWGVLAERLGTSAGTRHYAKLDAKWLATALTKLDAHRAAARALATKLHAEPDGAITAASLFDQLPMRA